MKASWKKLWVRALRGGKYKQGRHALRNSDNTTCCLGVLCDLVDPKGWDNKVTYSGKHLYLGESGWTPLSTRTKVSLYLRQMHTLARMNDKGATFDKIANYIEKNL
jgi:hypothetical protein